MSYGSSIMHDNTFIEKDWKLFRKLLPRWQERYMEMLIKEYSVILSKDVNASEKFWELEKRIWIDKKKSGVCIRGLRRSRMLEHIMSLLNDGTIKLDDLEDFSDSLRDRLDSYIQLMEHKESRES